MDKSDILDAVFRPVESFMEWMHNRNPAPNWSVPGRPAGGVLRVAVWILLCCVFWGLALIVIRIVDGVPFSQEVFLTLLGAALLFGLIFVGVMAGEIVREKTQFRSGLRVLVFCLMMLGVFGAVRFIVSCMSQNQHLLLSLTGVTMVVVWLLWRRGNDGLARDFVRYMAGLTTRL